MGDDEGESVQVAVRMRIFNGREKTAGAHRIVRMVKEVKGSRTFIKNPETEDEKGFSFDYSFNSHGDDPEIGPFCTQDTVFNDLGRPVLDAALGGKNVCLFAYGQTGAGKSFSMLGKTDIPELQGIIPRSCIAIFAKINEEKDNPLRTFLVQMQTVEVYCEQINDLLADRKKWPPNGHKPKMVSGGAYDVDTVKKPCSNFPEIEQAFKFADKNRSVGSHALNPESSRAHTIYTIWYVQRTKTAPDAPKEETLQTRINLVDLAGSERTESAGTSGQMLKEGNAINLSLTALGNCIFALSEGKKPGFRESKLTLLLQGSMTNGKVVMIAAVSPASICFDESISTLRFAERIKTVKVKAKKNITVDPVAEVKKEMEEMRLKMQTEIDELKARAEGKPLLTAGGEQNAEAAEEMERLKQLLADKEEAEVAMKEEVERRAKELAMTAQERQAQGDAINNQWKAALGGASLDDNKDNIKVPHLLNLNAEPRLAETLIYKLNPGSTVAGRSNKDTPPALEFNGMGIVRNHCEFSWDEKGKKVGLKPTAPNARCLVNGTAIPEDGVQINHNDRVWLGNNYAFRFAFPGNEDAAPKKFEENPDFFFAEQEIAEKAAAEKGESNSAINHTLSEALKKVEQANIISTDLSRECVFQPKLVTDRQTGDTRVVVMMNMAHGSLVWPWDKFSVRLVDMVKQWEQWQYAQNNDTAYELPPDPENPFVDIEAQLIGEADFWLSNIANMIEMPESMTQVLNFTGQKESDICVSFIPCDKNGGEGPWDDDDPLDPFMDAGDEEMGDFLRKKLKNDGPWEIQFKIKIDYVRFEVDLQRGGQSKYKETFVRYKLNEMDAEYIDTPIVKENCIDPKFGHTHHFKVVVDETFLKHMLTGKITFRVWGKLLEDMPTQTKTMRTILPPGWKKVTAYEDPDGNLHREAPKVTDA